MASFVVFASLLAGSTVLAQATPPFVGGKLAITWVEPTETQGRLDCNTPSSTCAPLNIASCDNPGDREIVVVAGRADQTITAGSTLFVWIEPQGSGECIFDDQDDAKEMKLFEVSLGIDDPLVTDATVEFPTDFDPNFHLTTTDLLYGATALGQVVTDACVDPGLDAQVYYLCFGIDLVPTDRRVTKDEPKGFIKINVDTVAPPEPISASFTALDGALQIHANAGSTTSEQALTWQARVRPAPNGTTPSDCSTWSGDFRTVEGDFAEQTPWNKEVSAPNNVLQEGCVELVDAVGNEGPPTPSFFGTPIDQCDFLECYPAPLETGCTAGAASAYLAIPALLGLLWRWRRR